jgi:hypothetical protein
MQGARNPFCGSITRGFPLRGATSLTARRSCTVEMKKIDIPLPGQQLTVGSTIKRGGFALHSPLTRANSSLGLSFAFVLNSLGNPRSIVGMPFAAICSLFAGLSGASCGILRFTCVRPLRLRVAVIPPARPSTAIWAAARYFSARSHLPANSV